MIFNPHKVYQYFKDNYVLGKASPKGWYPFDCPYCGGEKKMAVQFEFGYTKCWSCGAASNVCVFVEQTENCDYFTAKNILHSVTPSTLDLDLIQSIVVDTEVSDITLPEGWQSIADGVGVLGDRARKYLEGRGFNIEELDFKGFGYCNEHHKEFEKDFFGYIIVPFKKDGLLSYYLGRDYIGNSIRYKNPPSDWVGIGKSEVIYNESALYLYKTVFVVEGWSDAETIGKNGTATLGWAFSKQQMDKYLKSPIKNLVFVPDAGKDKATEQTYYQKAIQTATTFLETDKCVIVVDLNYLSDFGKDINEIGWDRVKKVYKSTLPLNWEYAMEIITA